MTRVSGSALPSLVAPGWQQSLRWGGPGHPPARRAIPGGDTRPSPAGRPPPPRLGSGHWSLGRAPDPRSGLAREQRQNKINWFPGRSRGRVREGGVREGGARRSSRPPPLPRPPAVGSHILSATFCICRLGVVIAALVLRGRGRLTLPAQGEALLAGGRGCFLVMTPPSVRNDSAAARVPSGEAPAPGRPGSPVRRGQRGFGGRSLLPAASLSVT